MKIRYLLVPAAVGASLVGGFAAAMFTLSVTAEADGTVATPSQPTASATVAHALWPGYCEDVAVTFRNDNDHEVVVDQVHGSITGQPGKGQSALVRWKEQPNALRGQSVPANGTQTLTIPNAVCLSPAADAAVQGSSVAAQVEFDFHVPTGTEYDG